jgi:hypothetical protein
MGDEKGIRHLEYNWTALSLKKNTLRGLSPRANYTDWSLGNINAETWLSGLGVERKADNLAPYTDYCCEIQKVIRG